jgi:16S rRNA (guanine966-N2)-methyltransferase
VREAVFSILGPIDGLRVLDLFAGSGAMAIESLSRGAAEATLVESSPASVAAIRRNLQALDLEAGVARQKAEAFLERARRSGRQYDLVFVDPPYRQAGSLGRGSPRRWRRYSHRVPASSHKATGGSPSNSAWRPSTGAVTETP